MELRVWVDGTQRVVCGVKLTTTCQEIVFALAHATQQAGRFTMIERWRNNERLLSPNEQPLVTLQRWGDHMNEVEFILKKTPTDITPNPPINQLQNQPQPQPQHQTQSQQQSNPQQDIYSTINKKRNNQPPAVPAKPRIVGPIAPVTSMPLHTQQLSSVNNAQMNFYHTNQSPLNSNQNPLNSNQNLLNLNQNPLNLYQNSLRPRHPPGYLDFIEAMANRNSLPHKLINNQNYAPQSHHSQSNMFQRPYDSQQLYGLHQNGASPNGSSVTNRYRYSFNGPLTGYDQNPEMRPASSMQNVNPIRPKLMETGLVVNRGSAVNVKLTPNNHSITSNSHNSPDRSENFLKSTNDNGSSVSQIGLDMLKVIEEQKKVLVNQKNELDRLDNDQEYWETKQNSEQAELINRIESEIRQLEELWRENQTQIRKLENQDFGKELEGLKSEQIKMEAEIEKQKKKLEHCENEIASCKTKIEAFEMELAKQVQETNDESTSPSSSSNDGSDELYMNILNSEIKKELIQSGQETKPIHTNGITNEDVQNGLETKVSEDEDYEDDSAGDASDDLNLPVQDNKHRTAKDVAYVDKRGLISGIRSLKLDKSRGINSQIGHQRSHNL